MGDILTYPVRVVTFITNGELYKNARSILVDKECRSGWDAVAVNGDPRKDYACAGGSAF